MEKVEVTIKAITKITTVEQMNNICAANIGKEVHVLVKMVDPVSFVPCMVIAIKTRGDNRWETPWEYYHISLELQHNQYNHYEIVNNIIVPKE